VRHGPFEVVRDKNPYFQLSPKFPGVAMSTCAKTRRIVWQSLLFLPLGLLLTKSAPADPASLIARIERLPRAQRLPAYDAALADPGLAPADRPAVLKAFARHAQQVSPLYGKAKAAWDERSWAAALEAGLDSARPDVDVAIALAQILVDANERRRAIPVVSAFKSAFPSHHYALAWSEWCNAPGRAEDASRLPTFPLHFCVLTRNPEAQRVATRAQCQKECEILNSTFRALDGAPLVRFELKGYTPFVALRNSSSELLRYGDGTRFDSDSVAKVFNACRDPLVRDPGAINIYVFDSFERQGDADVTSHGKRNSNRPYVFLDWQRLDNRTQNAEAHEMGHAFGLEHVGVPGAGLQDSTNIMTSAGEGFGSGGRRDLGFSPAQIAIIRYHAGRTATRLGLRK